MKIPSNTRLNFQISFTVCSSTTWIPCARASFGFGGGRFGQILFRMQDAVPLRIAHDARIDRSAELAIAKSRRELLQKDSPVRAGKPRLGFGIADFPLRHECRRRLVPARQA